MKLKECCAHPLLAFVIFLVISIIAILTTFIVLRMNDKPPHFSPLESPKASTNSPESRKSQNQTIENHLPVSRPPTSSDPPIVTCESPECVTLAHKLLNYRDVSIDPCENFHRASCGRYYENSLAENSIQEKQVFLQRIVKEFVLNRQPSTSKSENTIKLLFEKCRHITAWDAPEETEIAYKEIMKDIEKLGWSLLDSKWNSSKFDLNDVLSKIAKIGVLDFGIFQFYPVLNHLIIAPSSRGVTEMSGIEKMINTFLDVNDLDVDENMISNHGKEIYEFDVKLKKLQFLDYPETITYSDLKSNISIVDFDGIIQSLFRSGRKEKLWPIVEKRVESYAQPLFAGDVENLETLLKSTPPRVVSNFLIFKFLQTSINTFTIKSSKHKKVECEKEVIRLLPYASLRVFVRNHFDKENLKIVAEMIEKSKKVFIEMIQESTWLHEKTKKAAILKVQKMTKMVGYPEEFEKTGALDTLFENLVILESDTYSILLKKIQRFKVELALENVASELGMELGGRLYAANAFYQPSINQLRVLAPFMDDPIFDSTYPEYVQIATLGKIINHEIGHGFDPNHRGKDENGEEKDLWQPEDLVEYEKRVKCLIEQYNEYDDPDFGKKLNGSVVISELVADGFGMDVAWKTFKKLGLASQAKLIGFKDYPIDKLFFQTVAVNLCNQRSKKDVDFAVQFDTHPTDSFRVNGVFSNMKAFAETFNCPVGSPMNPKKKCDLF